MTVKDQNSRCVSEKKLIQKTDVQNDENLLVATKLSIFTQAYPHCQTENVLELSQTGLVPDDVELDVRPDRSLNCQVLTVTVLKLGK